MGEQETRAPKVPPAWFVHVAWRVHRALYRLSGGRFLWTPENRRGWGAMHLTTTGHCSGEQREVIVGYIEDGPDLVVVAMNGWDEGHPAWWRNLQAHPDALVRLVGRQERRVRARKATGEEHERLWRRWIEVEPPLEELADRRATETPVIVFEPLEGTD